MALYYIGAFMAVRALPSAFDRARSAEKDFDVLRHTGGKDGPRVLFVGNSRLIFCEAAWSVSPQDPQNPSFS